MADTWITGAVTDVQPGDRVRLASGAEILVSRVEPSFMGRENSFALIEDTPERWFKQPVRAGVELEILRAT
jgi:hypothetical protein